MLAKNFEKISDDKKKLIITKGIEVFSKFSFVEARTDLIVREAGISKGLLFYYFGSKKNFYLYLLSYTVDLLTRSNRDFKEMHKEFYEMIFDVMDMKYNLITGYPQEMKFLNMVSKETNQKVSKDIKNIFAIYHKKSKEKSVQIIFKAVSKLNLRPDIDIQRLVDGLHLYMEAIVMKYLNLYQDNPQDMFNNFHALKKDIREYLDLMIYGIVV